MSTPAANPTEDYQPFDYVFAGRRLLKGGGVGVMIFLEVTPGRLDEGSLYDGKAFKRHVIGGVYRGATFCGDKTRGLAAAKYVGRWASEAARIDWRIRDEDAETELRALKLSNDARKVHEIEAMLLPLRKLYAGYFKRRDSAGQEALEQAVLRALRCAPRSCE